MVCSKTGSKQQNVKAIDVKIETNPFLSGRYDALCVKDEGQHSYVTEIMCIHYCGIYSRIFSFKFLTGGSNSGNFRKDILQLIKEETIQGCTAKDLISNLAANQYNS